jgi:hypothetical protein
VRRAEKDRNGRITSVTSAVGKKTQWHMVCCRTSLLFRKQEGEITFACFYHQSYEGN